MELERDQCAYNPASGVLSIRLHACLDSLMDVDLLPWAQGAALRDVKDGPRAARRLTSLSYVRGCGFDVPLFTPELLAGGAEAPDAPVLAYARTLPPELLAPLTRLDTAQLDVLQLCAVSPRARQLLHNDTALLWLLAPQTLEAVADLPDPEAAARLETLFSAPRLHLLQRLVPAATARGLALLRRLRGPLGRELSPERLLPVLDAPDALDALRPFPAVNAVPLILLKICPGLLELRALRHLPLDAELALNDCLALGRDIADALRLGAALGIPDPPGVLRRCPEPAHIRRLHTRWTTRLNERLAAAEDNLPDHPLPPPLLPGTAHIHPITREKELRREGRSMHHCIASYLERIRSGTYAVYRMDAPERATIGLYLTPHEDMAGPKDRPMARLDQIRLCHNHAPSSETRRAVAAWLEQTARNAPRTGPCC